MKEPKCGVCKFTSFMSLRPFPCQLSRNLVCYTCLPSQESSEFYPSGQNPPPNWLLGSFIHVTSRCLQWVSIVCSIDGTRQTPTKRKQPNTNTHTHTHTHTHTNIHTYMENKTKHWCTALTQKHWTNLRHYLI